MNHRSTAATLASCALALAALTACGSHDPATAPAATASRTPKSASATASGSPSASPAGGADSAREESGRPAGRGAGSDAGRETAAGLPPRPDANGEAAYVRALTAIDPDIVHDDEDGAVDRGRTLCRTLHDHPDDRDRQTAEAEKRFVSPGHPDGFGPAKAGRIVDAVRAGLCPGP
ncbi:MULTISPECIES: DUF732 domain-containing protein [unclassified Streptomyces]|uniref:DUF732 domain-containing protein n=1 Tax=unclassified Streptomyces TaxID=2593676 RepID=UPI001F04BB67|nr:MULTISPECIES: hypothetical protein [unclassified Streptomyces]MCH0566590.1 hypothetical protein [Streptomyces sp. MUM 2J]MCH0572172.1 hypothetical protein [Streptomyces sp. MUM 136J]